MLFYSLLKIKKNIEIRYSCIEDLVLCIFYVKINSTTKIMKIPSFVNLWIWVKLQSFTSIETQSPCLYFLSCFYSGFSHQCLWLRSFEEVDILSNLLMIAVLPLFKIIYSKIQKSAIYGIILNNNTGTTVEVKCKYYKFLGHLIKTVSL